jgi:hypothetical protein
LVELGGLLYHLVIGLVQMLSNLEDPTAIGPAMAVALLTQFYGLLLAEFVFAPAASECEHRAFPVSEVTSGLQGLSLGKLLGFALGHANRRERSSLHLWSYRHDRLWNTHRASLPRPDVGPGRPPGGRGVAV